MTRRIFLIRHGLTLWNNEFRYQGHTDIELSPEGRTQAHALQQRLKQEKITAIFSSNLKRAVETAEIINEPHQLEIKINPLFKEINFGIWEGLTYNDLQIQYPEQLKTWIQTPHLLKLEKGETFDELRDRAILGMQEVLSQHKDGNILVVSHGGTIASLICGLLHEPLVKMWEYKQKNAALNILQINNEAVTIEILNDTSHLENE